MPDSNSTVGGHKVANLWPGCAPTLDGVMFELRRIDQRLRCVSGIFKIDSDLLRELAAHRDDPARNPHPTIAPRQKSAFILQAEAMIVFVGYCNKELQRLAEKKHHLEQGTLRVDYDEQWRRSNEQIAHRAIEMEAEASAMLAQTAEPDLFSAGASL